jgi:hypothetical protein
VLGNSETKTLYRNFELLNLHTNAVDHTHQLYTRYLQYNQFIPPNEVNYFEHMSTINLPADPPSTTSNKGAFNVFPLALTSDELNKSTSSALGKTNIPSPPIFFIPHPTPLTFANFSLSPLLFCFVNQSRVGTIMFVLCFFRCHHHFTLAY